jgi:hypothetical protein
MRRLLPLCLILSSAPVLAQTTAFPTPEDPTSWTLQRGQTIEGYVRSNDATGGADIVSPTGEIRARVLPNYDGSFRIEQQPGYRSSTKPR